MKKLLALAFILVSCERPIEREAFTKDLQELKEYFHIPGLAVIVTKGDQTLYENYLGFADVERQIPMDSLTTIPMASITKMFAGKLLTGSSSLEEPINNYIDNSGVGDSIKVKHILSHTSQGSVGKHFYYSGRFSWLTKVIEKEYAASYESVMNSRIIVPYGLHNTYLLKDSAHGRKIAQPYVFEGETKPGFIDYGYSSAAGITATVRDIEKFGNAIDDNGDQYYGYGLFLQAINEETVFWSYGQYDCYSSLFIRVPGKDLTLVMAANNNLMSDPARMIYGDAKTSLFALSFIRNFVSKPIHPLDLDKLRARALAESFLAMYDPERAENSKDLLRTFFKASPHYSDLSVLHNLLMLKEVARHNEQPNFVEFDREIRRISSSLLTEDPDNPYVNYYLANFYQINNVPDSARLYFQKIVGAKNFDTNWYTREAESWLKQNASSASGTPIQPQE